MASGRRIMGYLPFAGSTTPPQALTYLLGISLFSISFLVFLNSSISFVITDLIGVREGVGDIVGTLGFVDELVALVACPAWGLVSDRLGVRHVAVIGYAVIGLALFLFVQARNVYPQLLLARVLFAVGATAAATMVTAILPALTDETGAPEEILIPKPASLLREEAGARDSLALSMDSEVTITPERFRNSSSRNSESSDMSDVDFSRPSRDTAVYGEEKKPPALAGFVGMFTGCGALVALSLFLPLPARFGKIEGVTLGEAVAYSFYVVGAVALLVSVFVFFGLRHLKGEDGKGWRTLLGLQKPHPDTATPETQDAPRQKLLPYWRLLKEAVRLGLTDTEIAMGYLGGFVARASTVAISLFIPLYVNDFFIRNGVCHGSPHDSSPELKEECRQAYVLASILTGVAQLTGLVFAPVFGYWSHKWRKSNIPILHAALFGALGYAGFAALQTPEFKDSDGRHGNLWVFVFAALIGFGQIGTIVCSLGSLGRGVLKVDVVNTLTTPGGDQETVIEHQSADGPNETAPLLENASVLPEDAVSRVRLKGSIAGVYSWCGGVAILLLTKLGGYLFDTSSTGAPFYMMMYFNVILFGAALIFEGRLLGYFRRWL